jgi:SPP1 gp7 family putative phage head morphogenesis protein
VAEPNIYQLADQHRAYLSTLDRVTARRMQTAYERILRDAQRDYARFNKRLQAWQADHPSMDPRGASPSRHWVFQQERYKALIGQLQSNLSVYAKVSTGAITDGQQAAMQKAQADNSELLMASLGGGDRGSGLISFATLPDSAIEAAVGFASDGTPLDRLLRERSRRAGDDAATTLVNGVALGRSPFDIATRLDSDLASLHWQNLRLARTEMMRAYREAQRVNMLQNSDVIAGWRWSSAADARSCPICIGQHGTVFPINHVRPSEVPPSTAQHVGLADIYAKPPADTATVG